MSEAERAGASRQDKSGRLLAGRYRLGAVLGRGGMGTVWRAEDETLGRTVAVKELRFPTNIDEDEKRRLITRTLREAKAIARIRNNSAVTVFDVVDEDDRPWIVMELVEGKSLAEAIREDGLLQPRRAAEVGLAILDVLRSAHREGILHRDVKPSNVLIAEDGRVVLTDFGIAQVEGDPSITSTGMLVGAPSYISPERARGHKPGPAADLWSLGGLLYASVEGAPPYDKGSAIATLTAVMTEPLEEPKNAGPLRDVIYGLLTKDPDQRLDDTGARAMLNAVLHAREPEPVDATKVVPLPAQPDRRAEQAASNPPGTKRGEEAAEKLRGALRSVRKAAVAAGAATTSVASRAKSAGSDAGSAGAATGSASAAGPGTGAPSVGGPAATAPAPRDGSGAAAASGAGASGAGAAGRPSARSGSVGTAKGTGTATGAGTGTGTGAGGNASAGGRSSGWPVMSPPDDLPDLPPRSAPRAPITDVVPRRTLVIIALVAVLAVVAVVLAVTLSGDGDAKGTDDKSGARSTSTASAKSSTKAGATSGAKGDDTKGGDASSAAGDDDSGTQADGSSSAGSQDSGSSDDAAGSDDSSGTSGSGVGAATSTYRGSQGFSIGLPAGWKYTTTDSAGARFTGPRGQKLLVAWTSTPKDDPVADWKNQERYMTRSQYHRIRIEKVDYRSWNTADWEFTSVDDGTKFRTIDRGFVVNDHLGYALMYSAKAADWDTALRKNTWKTLTATFEPAS
ncbi:serine/threonine-protein kinase [Streptomyces mangrovisoli]|uniref:non-specific serine/threonine protein kinase n=1 Tax=Streptomyces mangrovisoli TaxID=1428628 RepID=A0A1J4P140_9ACTN|nr:serine/threonine-protein kinase [Streptomyces mangrovisoli]OIJ67444.1 serine/threonine protein kinase [Streptomyces mangrovisoli]